MTSIGGQIRQSSCAAPRLRLTVRPKRISAGEPVRLRIRVRPPIRARIAISGSSRSGHTSPRGKLRLTETFLRSKRVKITAFKPGYRPGSAILRVR